MAEPLSPERLDEITEQAAQVVETFGDDWYLVYDSGLDEVSARTDEGAPPFEGAYTPVFETSQWPEDSPRSPLAEFLAASIVVVPELLGEVERLRKAVELLGKELQAESGAILDAVRLHAEVERLRAALEEVKLRTVQRDLHHLAREALDGGEQ